MTSWRDLQPRVEALKQHGLAVKLVYRSIRLPGYLAEALEGDVLVLSAKDVSADDTLCVVRLEWLEKLIAAANKPLD
jgi:hypothetical protein